MTPQIDFTSNSITGRSLHRLLDGFLNEAVEYIMRLAGRKCAILSVAVGEDSKSHLELKIRVVIPP